MNTPDVFISYASKDVKVATTLCKALESRKIRCWIASRDIQPGENFQVSIVQAIRTSKLLLLVFTGNSNTSEEMTKELALASQQKKIVIPLRIEDVAPSDAFAYEFATRQWIDFFANWESAVEQLAGRINHALADPSLRAPAVEQEFAKPEPAPAPPPARPPLAGTAQIAKPSLATSNPPPLAAPKVAAKGLPMPARIAAAIVAAAALAIFGYGIYSASPDHAAEVAPEPEAPITPAKPITYDPGPGLALVAPPPAAKADAAMPQIAVAQIRALTPVESPAQPSAPAQAPKRKSAPSAAPTVDIPY